MLIFNFVNMKIEKHIAQLLYRYPCVTVPGFGAFLTAIQSAQIIDATHSFSPPKKVLSFNSYIKNNDGLLANHVSQSEKISYEKAVDWIQDQTSEWNNSIQNNQVVILNHIGQLSLNQEGKIIFEASHQVNYFTDAFGLNSFVSPLIKREILKQNIVTAQNNVSVPNIALETKTTPNYLKYAAIFVVGTGMLGYFGNNYYQNQLEQQTQIVQIEVQKEVENKIQEATFFIKNPLPKTDVPLKDTEMPYHIVAGVFKNENNAQKILDRLTSLGYKAKRIEKNQFDLYPVLFGSYASYAEAQKVLEEIHKKENPEAWLMIKNL